MGEKWIVVLCCIALLGIVGCECLSCNEKAEPGWTLMKVVDPVTPAPVQTPNRVSRVNADSADCGSFGIDKQPPATVQLGQPFGYIITVTNLTGMEQSHVIVNDRLPANFEFKSADPAATPKDGMLAWVIDTLAPNASRKIAVTCVANEVGWVQNCADATFVITACAKTQVVQPALSLSKTCPGEVSLCDQFALKYVVTNTGTGLASNVMITDTLPDGLTQVTGQKTVDIKVGDLAPGESMAYTVMAKANKTGAYKGGAMAKADGNLKTESQVCSTAVKQPVLAITKTGMEKQYLGRRVSYQIVVANKGDAMATNLALTDTIPAGVSNVVASDGGQVATDLITWNLGTLAAGQSRKVTVGYLPQAAGSFDDVATASATCCQAVTTTAKIGVSGIAAILLEVVDVSDPIEVGKNETYIIEVTNQGSAPDTDIKVVCKLEDAMQFVSASGATTGSHANGVVTFQPLGTLAPKAKAIWKVEVKAGMAGDVRFTTTLTSKQLGREVMETEATNFYQ